MQISTWRVSFFRKLTTDIIIYVIIKYWWENSGQWAGPFSYVSFWFTLLRGSAISRWCDYNLWLKLHYNQIETLNLSDLDWYWINNSNVPELIDELDEDTDAPTPLMPISGDIRLVAGGESHSEGILSDNIPRLSLQYW